MTIKEMPHVTTEQILVLRDAAIKLETERDELLAHVERLRAFGKNCAEELIYMIDTHNQHNTSDNSYLYDHQTPVEFLIVVNETPAKSLEALKKQLRDELVDNAKSALNNTKTWGGSK